MNITLNLIFIFRWYWLICSQNAPCYPYLLIVGYTALCSWNIDSASLFLGNHSHLQVSSKGVFFCPVLFCFCFYEASPKPLGKATHLPLCFQNSLYKLLPSLPSSLSWSLVCLPPLNSKVLEIMPITESCIQPVLKNYLMDWSVLRLLLIYSGLCHILWETFHTVHAGCWSC